MNIAILSQKPSLYSTRRLLEAGRERGHQVRILNHVKCRISICKEQPEISYEHHLLENIDAIIPRIGASVTHLGAAVIRQFELMNVRTATKSDALLNSRDKLICLQLLTAHQLPVPKTVFAHASRNPKTLIEDVGGVPLVIKLLEGTQGIGVILAENDLTAQSTIEAFTKLKAKFLIQKFIKEAAGTDIRAFVVDGEVVGAMKRSSQGKEFRSNLHRGGTSVPVELSERERIVAIKAAKVLGLGVAGVDLLRSNDGPLIMEVNASPGLEGIETTTNVDIAGKIVQYLEKKVYQHQIMSAIIPNGNTASGKDWEDWMRVAGGS